jgi:3-deoxy-D-manno-octulosonate 8-phosphate phosphatase (KDO 8-P phosphatase)
MLTLADRCRAIELLVLDADGVLTAGGIVLGQAEEGDALSLLELKEFHVRDGLGLRIWREAGKQLALISGRHSRVLERRAAEIGAVDVLQDIRDKGTAFGSLLEKKGLRNEQSAFVGDDLIDVPALRQSGLAVAVADACPEALAAAHYVTLRPGGRGAVREVIERILRCQGLWPSGNRGPWIVDRGS